MRRSGVLLAVLTASGLAQANGRPPGTSTIHFQRTHEDHIIAGLTFGLIESNDGGATWEWLCEDAIGYGGMFDPVYAYTDSGAILATTFHGLRIDRTGCDFELQPDTGNCTTAPDAGLARCTFITTVTQLADGTLFYGASDPNDAQIYKSTNDAQSWTAIANPGEPNDAWLSIVAAPSDNQVMYLADLRIHSATSRDFPLFKSNNGGSTFVPMGVDPKTQLTTSVSSSIEIVGVDNTDPNTFYIEINVEDGVNKYGIWKTTNGGDTFTEILSKNDKIAFIVRANGDLVAGTVIFGTQVSHDKGLSWSPVPGAPHINCLAENSAGELWACTADKGSMAVTSDGAGIEKTVDLVSWTKVLNFEQQIVPRMCPAGSIQQDVCDSPDVWCIVKQQVGLQSDAIACPVAGDDFPADASMMPANPKGCCDSGGAPVGLALVPPVAMLLLRRRRRP